MKEMADASDQSNDEAPEFEDEENGEEEGSLNEEKEDFDYGSEVSDQDRD